MKKYSQKYIPLLIGTSCAIGILIGSFFNFPTTGRVGDFAQSNQPKHKLGQLIDYINRDYVDEVDTDSIVNVAISNILSDLDPHSTYIPKKKFKQVSEDLAGSFVGIGVQFFQIRDSVAVIRTLANSPGEKAGLLPGDRIVYADQVPLYGKEVTSDTLKTILRGKINSTVQLKVKRYGEPDLLKIKVKRQRIPLKSVDAAYMLADSLGYIKLNRFSKNSYKEFKSAIKKLEKQGGSNIILDLRNNGGGLLKEAIKITDEFLKDGELILITKDKNGRTKKTYATEKGDFQQARVYVLINQNSASASEILAGALQDNDIGTIVGRRSYGKGLVQREMSLPDGSAVRLTVARYYTPTGRSIQKPYKKESNQQYFHDRLKRYKNGELINKDSIQVNDSLKFTTPGGKVVYGGGGIIPDVFVPKDLNYKKESLDYMLRGGLMERFIFEQLDKDRSYYNQLSREDFQNKIVIDNDFMDDFISYLSDFHLNFAIDKYKEELKIYLKATMARQLYGTAAYEHLIDQEDPMIKKVLERRSH